MALEAIAWKPAPQWVVLWEVLSIVEPLGHRQAQHALGTQCAYWTSFQYPKSQDTLAILHWMTC